jgi:formate dehydrogenase iron-sulfur subunit
MTVVRISDEAAALACGADAVAAAFEKEGCTVERVSGWGMHWLEPLVEIDGIGWGPVTAEDVPRILPVPGRICASARSPITPSSPARPG